MSVAELSQARESLRDREQITAKEWAPLIGLWRRGDPAPATIIDLPSWAEGRGVEAVIWTALGPKFAGKDEGLSPSVEEVIAYLGALSGSQRDHAKEYIVRTPGQIDTEYRRRIEAALRWHGAARRG
jgi:hypothetical protein